jgi:hypothetical protein
MAGVTAHFAHRFRFLRWLRASLVAGALYDFAGAAVLAAGPRLLSRWLGLPLPGEPFYLWIGALMLVAFAALYLFAAHDPRRHSAIIGVAIVGRLAAAGVCAAAAFGRPELAGLFPAAAVELTFGALHAIFWLPIYW